jgi:hypothetical protein
MDDESMDIEQTGADQLVALARLLQPSAPPSGSGRRRRIIPVTRSAVSAAGTASDDLNGRLLREAAEAIVGPGINETEAVADAVALFRGVAPRDVREAMIARRLIALDALAVETLHLAKASTAHPMLYAAYASQAVALSKAATELDEALERRRVGGQRVVEVKHVVVHNGGQAIVGPVTAIAPKPPSSPPR